MYGELTEADRNGWLGATPRLDPGGRGEREPDGSTRPVWFTRLANELEPAEPGAANSVLAAMVVLLTHCSRCAADLEGDLGDEGPAEMGEQRRDRGVGALNVRSA